MKKYKEEGFLTGVSFIPVLPLLSDLEEQLEKTIKTVKEYRADFIFIGGLTLFGKDQADCKMLYYKFLERHYPDLVAKYKSLYRIFFAPPKDCQKELEESSKRLCEKYGIKNKNYFIMASERNTSSLHSSSSFRSGHITCLFPNKSSDIPQILEWYPNLISDISLYRRPHLSCFTSCK
ncbi:MAG: hypothetical protein QXG39_07600, partial [Candidatus Aenigmatarchaeota archaeon]